MVPNSMEAIGDRFYGSICLQLYTSEPLNRKTTVQHSTFKYILSAYICVPLFFLMAMYRHIRVGKVKFTKTWASINRHGSWVPVMMIGP
jgi:hypothetical protein